MCLAFQWVGETHKSEELRNVRYSEWEHRWTRQNEDRWRWPETVFEKAHGLSLWILGWLVLSCLQNSREIHSPGLLVPWLSFTSWWTKLSDSPCEPVHKSPSQPTLHLPETSLSIVSDIKVDGLNLSSLVLWFSIRILHKWLCLPFPICSLPPYHYFLWVNRLPMLGSSTPHRPI